ncbi:hypothetical protein H8B06_10000 [Sphingobacterium sp. DN00404]|uniref:Uncharacterized protein n=1 Tax=Sphingobacterium micropteri TaxID=2763501 RepID=A0ABR7YPA3_9SPHI|nr:hypothetical protein [Sphingobacterium micropteri]MBD1433158.1 hypothetical protein [Sphingobacterium micropteri]
MAIQKDGPNGAYIGKVGSVYGYVLNGQNIIRGKRKPSTKKPTEGMLLNREKMKVASSFSTVLVPCLRYGYRELAPKGSRVGAVQLAQSHVFKECLEIDEKGKPFVNPEKVRVFRGNLNPPKDCLVWRENDRLHFKWSYEAERGSETYRINILIYDIDHEFRFNVAEEDVHKGEYSMLCTLLAYKKGPLHVYIGVVDVYTEELSDSVYVGLVE